MYGALCDRQVVDQTCRACDAERQNDANQTTTSSEFIISYGSDESPFKSRPALSSKSTYGQCSETTNSPWGHTCSLYQCIEKKGSVLVICILKVIFVLGSRKHMSHIWKCSDFRRATACQHYGREETNSRSFDDHFTNNLDKKKRHGSQSGKNKKRLLPTFE